MLWPRNWLTCNKTLSKLQESRHNTVAEIDGIQQPRRNEGCELYTKELESHLSETLNLPAEAAQWLLDVWACIQLFDDVADSDAIDRKDLDKVIWITLVSMHTNQFFEAKKAALLPVVVTCILKWQGSDAAERAGAADARSYVWRAGYYDLVLFVVQLCHGHEVATKVAPLVMSLYGETFEDYKKEFANA